MQFFSLFSYEFSPNDNIAYNAPAEMHSNYQVDTQPSNNWHFSGRIIAKHDSSAMRSTCYSVTAHQASPKLENYFTTIVAPLLYDVTIKNYYAAIPGYTFSNGLRGCISQLSQFSHSDTALIAHLTKRLETYCTFIEGVLFNDRNHEFCDAISYKDQVKLVKVYANFLKEFYAGAARGIFEKQSKNSSLMQEVMPSITWDCYDASDAKNSLKKVNQQYAASVNGKLGLVYKALHEGNNEKAYNMGHEEIKAVARRKNLITSVFKHYPELRQKVEQAYYADKEKAKQESIAKQAIMQQDAAIMEAYYEAQDDEQLFQRHPELLENRYNAATMQYYNSQFFKTLHKVLERQADYIDIQHLTSDQKGILFEGSHLQHHLIDEAISVVDVAISGDLTESVQDAVLDLANTSILLNKEGDVFMASNTLDVCWAFLDYAQDAARDTYAALSPHLPPVVKGMCDGVYESLHGAVHTVCHPVKAAQEAAQSLAVVGYCLGKVAYANCVLEAAHDMLESDPKRYEQMIAQYAIDPTAFSAMYEHVKENISLEAVARVGTKTVVDMMLLHGATKVVSAIAKECWVELISCMGKGEQSAEVVLTAENIPVKCTEEIASLMNSTEKVGGSAEVVNNSAKNAVAEVKRYGKQGSPYQKISKSTQQHARPLNRLKGKDLIGIENISVPGYGPLPKRISLSNYKHYLQPEIRVTSTGKLKPSGWHHDPGKRIANIKRFNGHKIEIENYKKHSSGIYKFDWVVDGINKKTSTFFPDTWSREMVQQKIVEAYKYARKHHHIPELQKNGSFAVTGFTNESINIKIIINTEGMVVTAYPVWLK
jgi:hypothetical protein